MTEMQLAYNLLRAALTGEKPGTCLAEASRWWSLFRLLQRNRVAALCYEAAAAAGVPREVLMPWLAEHEKAVGWQRHQRQVQQEIVDTMAKHGIDTLVLKGTHVAQYYPRPEEREFCDLDLYFYDRHDAADRVAREVLKVEVGNDAHHHSKYNYRGVTVESHYDFVNTHYPPSNRRYEALLKQLSTANGQQPTFEVLFLLRHMACHFAASRITLRDLVDWTLTCCALQEQVDWGQVQSTICNYGMAPFVGALNGVADSQLGYQPPIRLQGGPDDAEATKRLEHNIVYGDVADSNRDGLGRLTWKLHRWQNSGWKRRMVYNEPSAQLLLASITSHGLKPQSILHKM